MPESRKKAYRRKGLLSDYCAEEIESSALIQPYLKHFSDHGGVSGHVDQHVVGETGCDITAVLDINFLGEGLHYAACQTVRPAVGGLLDGCQPSEFLYRATPLFSDALR